jgi:hypothetical protein
MKDFQIWFYVILGVIYVVSRFFKKSEQPAKDMAPGRPDKPVQRYEQPASKPAPGPKALTFDELLREITEGKAATEQRQPAVPQTTRREYVDYDDELEEEEKDLEDTEYDYRKKDTIYAEYEDAKRMAFHRASLEETMKVGDTSMDFGRFKIFEEKPERNLIKEYLGNLDDAEGMKKAIVMSEILRPKF